MLQFNGIAPIIPKGLQNTRQLHVSPGVYCITCGVGNTKANTGLLMTAATTACGTMAAIRCEIDNILTFSFAAQAVAQMDGRAYRWKMGHENCYLSGASC